MLTAVAALVWFGAFGAHAAGEPAPDPAMLHGPRDIAAGPDGALWVADSLGIARFTRDGQFSRPVDAPGTISMVRGPDDAMWFTQYGEARIGRIAPNGHVDYFSDGFSSPPFRITSGPDGNLWFTERDKPIGRITPAGVVTEFTRGLNADSAPDGITAGRDGNVWFTDYHGWVGRVTPAGRIKEFSVPYDDIIGPEAIASGRDGALWFSDDDRLGRMTTRGHVRMFKVPFDLIEGITLGSDGNMWVAGYVDLRDFGAAVARVTPRGKVRLFRKGFSGDDTSAITHGPGRALWVAEEGRKTTENGRQADAIARLTVRGAVREFPPTPPCVVPSVTRLPLALVDDLRFISLCGLDRRSRRAGERTGRVALGISPPPGSVRPFNSPLHVRFGPVPPLPKHCRLPFGGKRIGSTPELLVFAYTDWDSEGHDSTTHYGACLRPYGRLRAITRSIDELTYYEEAAGFKIAGDFVAYTFFTADHYGFSSKGLRVYDVRSGHHVFSQWLEHHEGGGLGDSPSNPELGEYAVSAHGAVAWLSHEGATIHLYAQGRSGGKRELDSGQSLSGLGFNGDTLSWTSASESRSAEVL